MAIQYPIKNNFNSGEWSPLLHARSDLKEYASAVSQLENFFITPQGGIKRRGGTEYINSGKTGTKKIRLVRFEFSVTQAYVLEFGDLYIRVYKDKTQIEAGGGGSPAEFVTPYTEAELFEIDFTQSADTLFMSHKNHPPASFVRISDASWTFADIEFDPPPFEDINTSSSYTLTVSAVTGAGVTVTASSTTFSSDDVGRQIQFKEILASRFSQWAAAKVIAINDYRYYGENLYIATSAGTTDIDPPVHTEGIESDGAVLWQYVNSGFGVATITGYTSITVVTVTVTKEIPPGYLTGYHKWAIAKWGGTNNGYPSSSCFFEERLWFSGSIGFPQTIWASKSADFTNFTIGSLDDDSLQYVIGSDEVNTIQWLSPGKTLLVGTAGGEFNVTASSVEEAITPTNIKVSREATGGSAKLAPLRVLDSLLYVQRTARKIRSFQYSFDTNSYASSDITLFAEHITESGIVELEYQREPIDQVNVVRGDGVLATATYLKDQSINGWARQIISGGEVESVCVMPAPDGETEDEVWLSVKRTIGGAEARHIEVISGGLLTNDVADSKFLDAHVFYNSLATTTITGLDHLEGETVSVLADGATHPDKIVSSGSITLDRLSSKVCVGKNYISKMLTLKLEAGANPGDSAQGRIKRISDIIVRMYKSVGIEIGSAEGNVDSIPFRSSVLAMDEAIPPFTGDKKIPFRSTHGTEGQIYLQQKQPLPLTVLALMPKIKTTAN